MSSREVALPSAVDISLPSVVVVSSLEDALVSPIVSSMEVVLMLVVASVW